MLEESLLKIETNRLILVPCSMKYYNERAKISSDIENTRFMMFLPNSPEETEKFILHCENQWQSKTQQMFEYDILLKEENNKFIGGICMESLFENQEIIKIFGENCADMGWVLDKNYWRKGFVTEAAQAIIKVAKSLGVKKMIAQCDSENIGSWRVMEKIGMKKHSDDGIRYNKSEPNLAKTEFMYTIDL